MDLLIYWMVRVRWPFIIFRAICCFVMYMVYFFCWIGSISQSGLVFRTSHISFLWLDIRFYRWVIKILTQGVPLRLLSQIRSSFLLLNFVSICLPPILRFLFLGRRNRLCCVVPSSPVWNVCGIVCIVYVTVANLVLSLLLFLSFPW